MITTSVRPVSLLLACALAPACFEEPVSATEMRMAVDDAVATGQAYSIEDGIVEITTSFTLGDGLRDVAQHVRSFVESQIPCSTVSSPAENTLVVDFGTLDDACSFDGRTFAGVLTVTFAPGDDQVVITHGYDGVTDGRATLDGTSTVTWTPGARHIVTDFTFTNPRGEFTATSDRTQTRIGERGDGITVDGVRDWESPRGEWHLDIESVELRAVDPVPQDGSYELTLPSGNEITMTFERIDADTIEVRIEGGRRDRIFRVSSAGDVDDRGDG
jgi:hypothetical protein